MIRQVALVLTLAASTGAQDATRMSEVVQSYVDAKRFMGAVLVARGNEVLFRKGYGSANLEWNILNSTDTKFRIGSITKQFTAAAILMLEERGRLKVDDPVKTLMPDAPEAWDDITIFHLLTHTSGIPSFTGFPDYKTLKLSETTVEKSVERFRDEPLEFEPGEKWRYSNSGYLLLGHLVEKASGQSYEEFLRENIFDPLGMNDSGYDSNSAIIPRRASGYSPSKNGIVNAAFVHMSIPHAAGALYSTVEDLLRWERGLFGGKVLSPESLAKMTEPFKNDYAMGVGVRTRDGKKVIDHGGGIEGFNTFLAYYPEDDVTAVALSNLNSPAPGRIARQLAALARGEQVVLLSEKKAVEVASETLAQYVGAYELRPGFDLTITLEDGRLMSQATGQGKAALFASSETRFFLRVVEAEIEFFRDRGGADVTHLVLYQGGREVRGERK